MAVEFKERRKFARHQTSLSLTIPGHSSRGIPAKAQVVDISEGGLGFETSQKMELGSSFTLSLDLPLTVQGDIVRAAPQGRKFRYGVRFHRVRMTPKTSFSKPRTMVRDVNKFRRVLA
ncbi:MAG: PilZ domain-containing protein [Elusimicrobiota bacterium]